MSIFSKPISELRLADLQELLDNASIENIRLEFKQEAPGKNEMMKKISSFANTYGGWLIIGAAELEGEPGRIGSLPGVDEIPNYKQTLVQWSFDAIGPPIDIQVSEPIPVGDKYLYVIFIPESDLAPHFLNNRKGIYIRTDEYSQYFEPKMATLDEILRLSGRRKIVLDRRAFLIERAKSRFTSYMETSYAGRGRNPNGLGSNLSLVISPRYPDRRLFEYADLLETMRNQRIDWRNVYFPMDREGYVTQHESVLVMQPGSSFSLLEVSLWGVLAYSMEIEVRFGPHPQEDDPEDRQIGIHLNHMLGHILVFTEHAKQMLLSCGYQGNLVANLELRKIRGVPWFHFPNGIAEEGARSILDDLAIINFELDTSRLIESRNDVVKDFLREIFFAVNWPEAAITEAEMDRLIAKGYDYNYWHRPERN